MALTLGSEQRLESVGLIDFFVAHEATWQNLANETYKFVKQNFPIGSKIRRDDVAKALKPVLEVNEALRDELAEQKLRGKFWVLFFTDLIIDRTWDTISREEQR
jgi:hypothetical protein